MRSSGRSSPPSEARSRQRGQGSCLAPPSLRLAVPQQVSTEERAAVQAAGHHDRPPHHHRHCPSLHPRRQPHRGARLAPRIAPTRWTTDGMADRLLHLLNEARRFVAPLLPPPSGDCHEHPRYHRVIQDGGGGIRRG